MPKYFVDGHIGYSHIGIGPKESCETLERYERMRVQYHEHYLHAENDLYFPNEITGGFDALSTFKESFLENLMAEVEKRLPNSDLITNMAALDQRYYQEIIRGP